MQRQKRVCVSGGRAFLVVKEKQRQITEIEIRNLILKELKKICRIEKSKNKSCSEIIEPILLAVIKNNEMKQEIKETIFNIAVSLCNKP